MLDRVNAVQHQADTAELHTGKSPALGCILGLVAEHNRLRPLEKQLNQEEMILSDQFEREKPKGKAAQKRFADEIGLTAVRERAERLYAEIEPVITAIYCGREPATWPELVAVARVIRDRNETEADGSTNGLSCEIPIDFPRVIERMGSGTVQPLLGSSAPTSEPPGFVPVATASPGEGAAKAFEAISSRTSPDAAVRLRDRFETSWAELLAAERRAEKDDSPEAREAEDIATDRNKIVLDRLALVPATTMAGLALKLRALATIYRDDLLCRDLECGASDSLLTIAIVRDLAGMLFGTFDGDGVLAASGALTAPILGEVA